MVVVLDLADTVVTQLTGKKFPVGVWDLDFNFDLLERLKSGVKKGVIDSIWIVTNQGGVSTGHITEEKLEVYMNYIMESVKDYTGLENVGYTYCPTMDGHDRLPDTGMLECVAEWADTNPASMIFIGDGGGLTVCSEAATKFGCRFYKTQDFLK